MAGRKLGADTSVALVAHISSFIVCSHRVGVDVKRTYKHLDKTVLVLRVSEMGSR